MIGVKKACISKYEKGRVIDIKRSTMVKLVAILDVDPVDLLNPDDFEQQDRNENR